MKFKEWFYLQEALQNRDIVRIELLKQHQDPEKVDQILLDLEKEFEDKPTASIKDIMKHAASKYPAAKKEKPLENKLNHFRQSGAGENELKVYQYYKNQGDASDAQLQEMMQLMREYLVKKWIELDYKDNPILTVKKEDGSSSIFKEPNFMQFIGALHGIQGYLASLNKSSGNYFDPSRELDQHEHLITKSKFEKPIWVFKGGRPDICRKLGKSQVWCISSTSSAEYWFDYRLKSGQTQYFIFDFTKDESDPARYVNPGIAPEGEYSEWVDAKNEHDVDPDADPDDPNPSHFGINGYTSINHYKAYLESQGIDTSLLVADPVKDWEKRLKLYYSKKDIEGARKDKANFGLEGTDSDHPFHLGKNKFFELFLKIAKKIPDKDFDALSDDEKKIYLMENKNFMDLSSKQLNYIIKNIKKDYVDSLKPEEKRMFAAKTEDKSLILKFLRDPKQKKDMVDDLYSYSPGNLLSNFEQAQKDPDSFTIHLSVRFDLPDKQFDVLSDEQKKTFLLGKIDLTDHQLDYVVKNFKQEHLSYMSSFGKMEFASRTQDLDLILKFLKDSEYKQEMISNILLYSPNLSDLEKKLGEENLRNINSLVVSVEYEHPFKNIISSARDKQAAINIIAKYYKKQLDIDEIQGMFTNSTDPQKLFNLLLTYRDESTISDDIENILSVWFLNVRKEIDPNIVEEDKLRKAMDKMRPSAIGDFIRDFGYLPISKKVFRNYLSKDRLEVIRKKGVDI